MIENDNSEEFEKQRKNLRHVNELEQEKILLKEINKYFEKNDDISKEIFDSFSHELRTPIVTIKSYTDMILNGAFGELSSEQKEKLLRVKENTELLIDTVMLMLDKIKDRK